MSPVSVSPTYLTQAIKLNSQLKALSMMSDFNEDVHIKHQRNPFRSLFLCICALCEDCISSDLLGCKNQDIKVGFCVVCKHLIHFQASLVNNHFIRTLLNIVLVFSNLLQLFTLYKNV